MAPSLLPRSSSRYIVSPIDEDHSETETNVVSISSIPKPDTLAPTAEKTKSQKSQKRKGKKKQKTLEEAELENLLFGSLSAQHEDDQLNEQGGQDFDINQVVKNGLELLGDELQLDEMNSLKGAEKKRKRSGSDGEEDNEENGDESDVGEMPLFFEDKTGHDSVSVFEHEQDSLDATNNEEDKLTPKAAWNDEDDANVTVDITSQKRLKKLRETEEDTTVDGVEFTKRLRKQHEKLYPTPSWALPTPTLDPSLEQDDSTSLFTSSKSILDTSSNKSSAVINPDDMSVVRLKDANCHGYNESIVSALKFHPWTNVLVTGGLDRKVRLFQVDGKSNPKIQSVHLRDLPVYSLSFNPSNGDQLYITGRRPFFYSYNLNTGSLHRHANTLFPTPLPSLESFTVSPNGKQLCFLGGSGYLQLVEEQSKMWIGEMKMNGNVKSAAWSGDGKRIWSVGGDGDVYEWDVGMRRCIRKWRDEGGFKNCCVAVSSGDGEDGYISIGSQSGITNIYPLSSISAGPVSTSVPQKPLKSLMNLTTPISDLTFNQPSGPSSSLLAFSSRARKDQFRLFHVPTLRVVSNWPTQKTPLGYVQCHDFSKGSGYLGIGNDKGKVLLYRLNAFDTI